MNRWTFVGKVISLLFNMLSRFVTLDKLINLSELQCSYLQNGGHNSYLSGLQRSIRLISVKVVLEKTLENLLDCKEIKPVNYKGKQP